MVVLLGGDGEGGGGERDSNTFTIYVNLMIDVTSNLLATDLYGLHCNYGNKDIN